MQLLLSPCHISTFILYINSYKINQIIAPFKIPIFQKNIYLYLHMALNEQINRIKEMMGLNNRYEYKIVSYEEFEDKLLDITTLNLEDDQVRIPQFDQNKDYHLLNINDVDLYIRNRKQLPESGSYELFISNIDGDDIGFIRGTKLNNILSFNLIYITPEHRGEGIGTEIYEYFLNHGYIIKSDSEITDSTYSIYTKLAKSIYKPIIFNDGRVGLTK